MASAKANLVSNHVAIDNKYAVKAQLTINWRGLIYFRKSEVTTNHFAKTECNAD